MIEYSLEDRKVFRKEDKIHIDEDSVRIPCKVLFPHPAKNKYEDVYLKVDMSIIVELAQSFGLTLGRGSKLWDNL